MFFIFPSHFFDYLLPIMSGKYQLYTEVAVYI